MIRDQDETMIFVCLVYVDLEDLKYQQSSVRHSKINRNWCQPKGSFTTGDFSKTALDVDYHHIKMESKIL